GCRDGRGRRSSASRRGARGLLQLLPATAQAEARHLGLASVDLDDPETNLILGAAHLRRLLDRYDGSVFFALAAYNAGPTALERWRRRAPNLDARTVVMREGYDETRMYVARVLAWYRHYRGGS
ncbi:MAG: transglycosylase SLT domain-containing protein, partial [Planctomycetota bacterium]